MSHRMQITLDDHQYQVLVVESARTGASIAQLIRRTLDERFQLEPADDKRARFRSALAGAAGVWRDRADDGVAYQQRVRASLRAREAATSADGRRRSR